MSETSFGELASIKVSLLAIFRSSFILRLWRKNKIVSIKEQGALFILDFKLPTSKKALRFDDVKRQILYWWGVMPLTNKTSANFPACSQTWRKALRRNNLFPTVFRSPKLYNLIFLLTTGVSRWGNRCWLSYSNKPTSSRCSARAFTHRPITEESQITPASSM